jgi:hypothetical protein
MILGLFYPIVRSLLDLLDLPLLKEVCGTGGLHDPDRPTPGDQPQCYLSTWN